jgi:hypothetical protein
MRGVAQEPADAQQVPLATDVPEDLALVAFLDQPYHALLYDVDEPLAGLALLKHDLVVLVKLHAPVLHQLKELLLAHVLKRGMSPQEVGDTVSDAGGSHPECRYVPGFVRIAEVAG